MGLVGVPYFERSDADSAWNDACKYLHNAGNETASRDLKDGEHVTTRTKEVLHATFCIGDPRDRVVFSRPINPAFAIAEVLWILSGSKKSNFLSFWNPRMKTWTDDGIFHGAYGSRLGNRALQRISSDEYIIDRLNVYFGAGHYCNFDQLYYAYSTLKNVSHSRQVILQIWDCYRDFPSLHGDPVYKDIPCNVFADLKVRDGKLYWLQMMRSNDLIWGTPYNFIQWTCIQEIMAGWLGLELGHYTHIASSLHVYEKHWGHLEDISNDFIMEHPVNVDSLMIKGYHQWNEVFVKVLEIAVYLATTEDNPDDIYENVDISIAKNLIHTGYIHICWLLTAEALRRRGDNFLAKSAIERTNEYWRASWLNWRDFIDRS